MNSNLQETSHKTPALASGSPSRVRFAGGFTSFGNWFRRHPLVAIMAMAFLAVTVSCYPIVFFGKSFVSPVGIPALLYDQNPFLPGCSPPRIPFSHASDPCVALFWEVPVGFIESRSILDHGEIPLWNRYGHAGDVLLGQAVTMLGDPLQMIVILGRGSAGAWDIKFLVAKWLFCVGMGWLVLRLLGNLPLGLICAALAAWCGAYIYIGSHPVFFVLAYAPWVLLSALEFLAPSPGGRFKWGLVWLVANVSCFYAGHVEAAVVLIGALNFAALVSSLAEVPGCLNRVKVVARLGVATLLFLGFTAPVWMSFLNVLPHAYATTHDKITIAQIPAVFLPELFDDGFFWYQPYNIPRGPCTSLLALAGCLLSIVRWHQLRRERFFWINTGAIIFWTACVFSGIPASWLAAVPLLNRVGHLQVDFSYLLVIHITLQTAYGFKSLLKLETFQQAKGDFYAVLLMMDLMVFKFFWTASYLPAHPGFWRLLKYYALTFFWPAQEEYYFLLAVAGAVGSLVLFKYLRARNGRVGLAGWTGIILLAFIPVYRAGLYNFGWSMDRIMPGPRAVLDAPSPALNQLKNDGDTFRVTGAGIVLAGDYGAVYGLEDIRSCAPLSNARFIELVRNFPGFSLPANDWAIKLLNPGAAYPLLSLLNVKYVLAHPGTHPLGADRFTVRNTPEFTVLENKQVWPRAFFASQIVPISSNTDFTRYLLAHGDHPFAGVDQDDVDNQAELRDLARETPAVITPAEHYELLPNATAFDVQATGPGVVCLTEGQGSDFTARANGQPVEVLTVNRAFKGIYLAKPGNYHVEFRFEPHLWRMSLRLFWLSAVVVLILAVTEFSGRRRQRHTGELSARKTANESDLEGISE